MNSNIMTFDEIIRKYSFLPAADISGKLNDTLEGNTTVVVTAPPGAGKSTLLPLSVNAGSKRNGKILMLEPRRIAARQIACRMAEMIGEGVGQTVGYRVRFESRVSVQTRIEVITEGILTRMLVADPTLDGVDTVIFDEFHERSINTDLSLALCRYSQQLLRDDLKIVVMSATIDASAICKAMNAPLIECSGRMFPVRVEYADEAQNGFDDLLTDSARIAARVVSRVLHEQEGDILVFLPGQGEIQRCVELLGDSMEGTVVFPLYGNLSPEQQHRAIMPLPDGRRKVVIASPIAETSLTIEGVRTVVDSGLCRHLAFDARSGLSHLETVEISRDMMVQRTGRAGRLEDGVCYRLWRQVEEHKMEDQRRPEIEYIDLAPLALEVAAFGENDIWQLPWLTPPDKGRVAQSLKLLRLLGAIGADGNITPLGKQMAAMPCHPRIAKMILSCRTPELKSLACDIAALLEEKDPMANSADTDISMRISSLRGSRKRQSLGKWKRIALIAQEYRRMVRVAEDNTDVVPSCVGILVANAYPERVAMALDDAGNFRLASGENVKLDLADSMSAYPWIAVASLYSHGKSGRVFLAAPVEKSDLPVYSYDNVSWNSKMGCVVAQREKRMGCLVVDSNPIADIDRKTIVDVVCNAAKKDGTGMFDWNDNVSRLQLRVMKVAEWHPELSLPDLSTSHILETADEWLPFYLENNGKIRQNVAELKKINMYDVLWAMIPYDLQMQIERLAPTHIVVPTGSRIKVDYRQGAAAPVLSVRLQECFGMEKTPCVNDGRQPLLMELLSPGFKPVQLTQDLESFWNTTYFEVRKELKRRYPKHYWPENPLEAEAVRGVKR